MVVKVDCFMKNSCIQPDDEAQRINRLLLQPRVLWDFCAAYFAVYCAHALAEAKPLLAPHTFSSLMHCATAHHCSATLPRVCLSFLVAAPVALHATAAAAAAATRDCSVFFRGIV